MTEILLLLLVGLVVVGPRKLPVVMKTAGQWVGKMRRLSTDLRKQSGIDEIIKAEGLEKELRELRSLSRAGVLQNLMQAHGLNRALTDLDAPKRTDAAKKLGSSTGETTTQTANRAIAGTPPPHLSPAARTIPSSAATGPAYRAPVRKHPNDPPREREYPEYGCDHYGALPDDLGALEAEGAGEEGGEAGGRADTPEEKSKGSGDPVAASQPDSTPRSSGVEGGAAR